MDESTNNENKCKHDMETEIAIKLHEMAWERFKNRRSLEGRISIAIWTALGGGIAGVVSQSDFKPSNLLFLLIATGTVVLLRKYDGWLCLINREFEIEKRTSWYWETYLHSKFQDVPSGHGTVLPCALAPPSDWPQYKKSDNVGSCGCNRKGDYPLHHHGDMVRLITWSLAVLLNYLLLERTCLWDFMCSCVRRSFCH